MILGCRGRTLWYAIRTVVWFTLQRPQVMSRIASAPNFSGIVFLYHQRKPLRRHWPLKNREVHRR
jgi:hypothetical protein